MTYFKHIGNEIELYFDGKPSEEIRTQMKALRIWWNPNKMCWHGKNTPDVLALAQSLCGANHSPSIPASGRVDVLKNKSRCCYYGTVGKFLEKDKIKWLKTMKASFQASYSMPLGEAQIRAWEDCFDVLQKELPAVNTMHPGLQIIFEYGLPFESGRRPDVILLSKEYVIILEFKQYGVVRPADVDQVKAYARDLREYHFESRDKKVIPILMLTGIRTQRPEQYHGIMLCSKGWLYELMNQVMVEGITPCNAQAWMDSKYEPLPTIVEAARAFMKQEELPSIRRVNSTVIPQAIQCLTEIARDAQENRKHVLAFVTGVPGAGKTYLGLQYVYDICESNTYANSVYLSGNSSLIRVLQDALNSKVFVKNVHTIVNEFISGKMNAFEKNVIVFDEGQRAWNVEQMRSKRRIYKSEPDVIVELCDTKLNWCVLLILVGEGQEIYNGENSGLVQWNTAIGKTRNDWQIVCPNKLASSFTIPVQTYSVLNLNQSLRTHTAGEVSNFVNAFIDGNLSVAAAKAKDILSSGFDMYYTRKLEVAKKYCRDRYSMYDNKRYGLMASSKSKNLDVYGMKPKFKADVATWFNKEPSNPASACALHVTISEFDCQGLEVDMAIVGWGNDIRWDGTRWIPSGVTQEEKEYRINSYRVLLTRGRDGFIVFIPPTVDMDRIEEVFKRVGVNRLEEN